MKKLLNAIYKIGRDHSLVRVLFLRAPGSTTRIKNFSLISMYNVRYYTFVMIHNILYTYIRNHYDI